ncbi:hypothetical protein EDD16DRAFT_1523298 [Pisolithus croceorrhizus]|nr:hypothetical protein EDD16DRAFT_1523298 [Pisolithus croceorrhizus]
MKLFTTKSAFDALPVEDEEQSGGKEAGSGGPPSLQPNSFSDETGQSPPPLPEKAETILEPDKHTVTVGPPVLADPYTVSVPLIDFQGMGSYRQALLQPKWQSKIPSVEILSRDLGMSLQDTIYMC